MLMVEHALRYANDLGWPVFPCAPRSKQPLYANPHRKGTAAREGPQRCRGRQGGAAGCGRDGHGVLDATCDNDQIVQWWGRTPNANIGLATGWPGMDVVDFDIKPGQLGRAAHRLLSGYEMGLEDLLSRLWRATRTASGGLHLYYPADPDQPQGNGANPKWGVDFRGVGGYVVAPPGQVGDGRYRAVAVRDTHDLERDLYGRTYLAFENPGQQAAHQWGPGQYLAPGPVRWDRIVARLRGYRYVDGQAQPVPPRVNANTDRPGLGNNLDKLVDWLSSQTEATHNRNNGLYWAARIAEENNATADAYRQLVDAAVANGLAQHEAERTIESARRHPRGNI